MRDLSSSLSEQKELLKERSQVVKLDVDEQQSLVDELEERILQLEKSLKNKRDSHLEKSNKHHQFLSGFKSTASCLFGKIDSISCNAKHLIFLIKEYTQKRKAVKDSTLKQIEWYKQLIDGHIELFVSQDSSMRMETALQLGCESNFSLKSCEDAIQLLSQSLYSPKSIKTTHFADLRKAIATNERKMDTLHLLKERLDAHELPSVTINQPLFKEELLCGCCFLYLLSDFGRLIHLSSQRVQSANELEKLFDQDIHLLLESLEILHETDLLQLPEHLTPKFDVSNVLVSTCIQSLTYLVNIHLQYFTNTLVSEAIFDQLSYFERIYTSYYKVSILLVRDILPKCINAKARNNSVVLLFLKKMIDLGHQCSHALHPDALKFNSRARELKHIFERLEPASNDAESGFIFESIQNIINELKTSRIDSISESIQNYIFVKLMILLGNLFEDGSRFIETSSLLLADPTAEFTNIFDFTQTMSLPDFDISRESFKNFMQYVSQELFYKPFFVTITNILKTFSSKFGKTVTKTWGTNSHFNENTSIPFVDHSNKYLNFFVKTGAVNFKDLELLKRNACQKGIENFIKILSARAESKFEWVGHTIESQRNSLGRYQMLHATELFEKSDFLDRLDSRVKFLNSISNHIEDIVALDDALSKISDEFDKLPSESQFRKGTIAEAINKHKQKNQSLGKFLRTLKECEYERLPDGEMVQYTHKVVEELQLLFKSKKKLEMIHCYGAEKGLLKMIDDQLTELHIEETKTSLRQLMKKLLSFFDSLKKLMDPVMRILDNIVTYAKNTNFSQDILKELLVLMVN
jgi:hypothetical protein